MEKYYDGTKLLSMKDANGNDPELYLCTSNRTAGKTTYFGRMIVNRFFDKGDKFALLYRFNYELDDCAEKFFKDLSGLFFNGSNMSSKRKANGIYHELFIDDKSCGYALSINSADQIKKYSHLFSDVKRILFDEFQSESNHYCPNEINKFISIHTSLARGNGEQCKRLPVYMIANPVSLINPYYVSLHISERLKSDTKFLRGDGFVLEQGFVESAANAAKESGFNKAFASSNYVAYSAQGLYLNDNNAFIEQPTGFSNYIGTLLYNGQEYGIREYYDMGIIYCNDKPDKTYPIKITVTTEDHQINYVMLKKNDAFIKNLRFFFEKGCFRFKNLQCKAAVLSALSY